jgi:dihydroflavonol-4-reductase
MLEMGGLDLTLITGASGFVGSAVAKAFRESGHQVRALVRSSSPTTNINLADMVVVGNICDRNAVAAAVRGVRYVVHAAADYRLWAPSPAEIFRTNVEGTRIVMQEALHAGVERIVYTSSVATIELRAGAPADESRLLAESLAVGAYKKSKVIAERMVEDMAKNAGLPVVIVNPATPIGPRDVKPTPTGRIIVEAARGRMPGYVDTGLNVVHVDDVALGHLLAAQHGEVGRRYILGGENMTLAEILTEVARVSGQRPPSLKIPYGVALPIAAGAEALARLTGREPFATVDGVRMSRKKMFFSADRAIRELGYAPRPARQAIADAVAWFKANGYLE